MSIVFPVARTGAPKKKPRVDFEPAFPEEHRAPVVEDALDPPPLDDENDGAAPPARAAAPPARAATPPARAATPPARAAALQARRGPVTEEEKTFFKAAVKGGLNPGTKLYDHQFENVQRFVEEVRAGRHNTDEIKGRPGEKRQPMPYGLLVADAPGLGKTVSAIVCASFARAGAARYSPCVLVVAPASLLQQWKEHLVQFWKKDDQPDDEEEARVCIWGEGGLRTAAQKQAFRAADVDALIISYDALGTANRPAKEGDADPAGETLFKQKYTILIADESHYLANAKTQRYAAVRRIRSRCYAVLCMSGTPYVNRLSDAYNQLVILRARQEFTEDGDPNILEDPKVAARLRETSLIRHDKSILGLPPVLEHDIIVPLDGDDKKAAVDALQACINSIYAWRHGLSGAAGQYGSVLQQILVVRQVAVSRFLLRQPDVVENNGAPGDKEKEKVRGRLRQGGFARGASPGGLRPP